MGTFKGLIGAGSSGYVASMPPPWHRLWGKTSVALETMAARPNCGVVRRNYWEQSVSFVNSTDQTVAMGVHACGAGGGGTGNNRLSVVILAAPTAATIAVIAMLPSVTLEGIPTTMVLLSPAVPPKIHPR